jgi:hypothetical protein
MGGARSCWLWYTQRLQVDEAADTLFFDRSPAAMPPQPRATYASRAKLGFVLQALMEIKNFLALFRK